MKACIYIYIYEMNGMGGWGVNPSAHSIRLIPAGGGPVHR
jgi:hypothetical protein